MSRRSYIEEMASIRIRAERLPLAERKAYIAEKSKEVAWMTPYPVRQIQDKVPVTVEWQVCSRKDLPAPSAAEELIIDALSQYRVEWHREVEFLSHRKSEYGLYRYDFYLPTIGLVIEYDGSAHHSNEQQLANDAAKDLFCRSNGITIVRLDKKSYYHMDREISKLMGRYGVNKNSRP